MSTIKGLDIYVPAKEASLLLLNSFVNKTPNIQVIFLGYAKGYLNVLLETRNKSKIRQEIKKVFPSAQMFSYPHNQKDKERIYLEILKES